MPPNATNQRYKRPQRKFLNSGVERGKNHCERAIKINPLQRRFVLIFMYVSQWIKHSLYLAASNQNHPIPIKINVFENVCARSPNCDADDFDCCVKDLHTLHYNTPNKFIDIYRAENALPCRYIYTVVAEPKTLLAFGFMGSRKNAEFTRVILVHANGTNFASLFLTFILLSESIQTKHRWVRSGQFSWTLLATSIGDEDMFEWKSNHWEHDSRQSSRNISSTWAEIVCAL